MNAKSQNSEIWKNLYLSNEKIDGDYYNDFIHYIQGLILSQYVPIRKVTEITIEFEETKYFKFPTKDLKSNQLELSVNMKEGQVEIEYFFDYAVTNENYKIDSYLNILLEKIQIKNTEISKSIKIPRESKNLIFKIRGVEDSNILKIKVIL